MRRFPLSLAASLLLLSMGCRREDDIQTYRVSKEDTQAMPMGAAPMAAPDAGPMMQGEPPAPADNASGADMNTAGAGMGMAPAASSQEISWTTPKGWKQQAPSTMRVGSFLVKGENGQEADVSVIPLSGNAGGDLANINRWRGQINLDPLTEANLSVQTEKITPGGRLMLLVDMISKERLINNQYKKRLVAAIYQQGSRSWFFKMLGEDATVASAKPAFLQFLKSLHFANDR